MDSDDEEKMASITTSDGVWPNSLKNSPCLSLVAVGRNGLIKRGNIKRTLMDLKLPGTEINIIVAITD